MNVIECHAFLQLFKKATPMAASAFGSRPWSEVCPTMLWTFQARIGRWENSFTACSIVIFGCRNSWFLSKALKNAGMSDCKTHSQDKLAWMFPQVRANSESFLKQSCWVYNLLHCFARKAPQLSRSNSFKPGRLGILSAFCRPSVEGMMSVVTSMSYARQSCWGSPRHQWPQRWPAFRVKHGETWGVFQTSGCLHDVYICLPLFTHVSQRIWNVDVVCHLYGSKICSLI
jgi:hypothetical protein